MSIHLRLVLGLTILIATVALVIGTGTSRVPITPTNSPYISALSNVAVGTAEAAGGCNRGCLVLQGIGFCRTGEGAMSKCKVSNGVCTETPCGH